MMGETNDSSGVKHDEGLWERRSEGRVDVSEPVLVKYQHTVQESVDRLETSIL